MHKLSIKQINNLITGNALAIEIPSSSEDMRAFVVIRAYKDNGHIYGSRVSKFLNSKDKKDTLYVLRKYEIKKEVFENDWDVSEDELINSVTIKNISSIEELEIKLSAYLDDYTGLDTEWKCDNPI